MNKKTKMTIIIVLIIAVAFVSFIIINHKKEDIKAQDDSNTEQFEMKVKPSGEPNKQLVNIIKGERPNIENKPELLNEMVDNLKK